MDFRDDVNPLSTKYDYPKSELGVSAAAPAVWGSIFAKLLKAESPVALPVEKSYLSPDGIVATDVANFWVSAVAKFKLVPAAF